MNDKSVLAKAFTILGVFRRNEDGLTVSEVARRTRMPLATVHRICLQLCDVGVLERSGAGRLRVGVLMWELGALAPRAHGVREAALPYLEDLRLATGRIVQLVALDGIEAVCLERLVGHNRAPLFGRPGGRLPLHASSCGLAILAFSPDDLLQAVLAAGPARFTTFTVTSEPELRRILARARQTGTAVSDRYLHEDWVTAASPIFDTSGAATASVCAMVTERAELLRVEPAVRATCRAITRDLTAGQGVGPGPRQADVRKG
jgi:DNA-binding IclR family transcriptional regulator